MTELSKNIQELLLIEKQLKLHTEKIKELRDKKNEVSKNIINSANMSSDSKKILLQNNIKIYSSKIYQPITFKYLELSLDKMISNKEKCIQMIEFIKRNRDFKTVDEVKINS
jgi:hypothetical protein